MTTMPNHARCSRLQTLTLKSNLKIKLPMNSILLICCALVTSATIHAGDFGIDDLIKERITLLTEIHRSTKASFDVGTATEDQVRNAALELYTLQRDAAKPLADRVKWQEQIIATEKQQKAAIEKRITQGTSTAVDGLRAAERVLAAEQKLLEIKSSK